MNSLEINSDEQMQKLGNAIGKSSKGHDLLLLSGDLGAGKTTLTKGIARALELNVLLKVPLLQLLENIGKVRDRFSTWICTG